MSTDQRAGNDNSSDDREQGAPGAPVRADEGDSILSDVELGNVAGGISGGSLSATNMISRTAPSSASYTIKP